MKEKNYFRHAYQALFTNTLVFATGFGTTVILSPMINSMPNLSAPKKFLFSSAPLISNVLLQYPLGRRVDSMGGLPEIKAIRIVSILGMSGLFVLSFVDPKNVDSIDWYYLTAAFLGMAAGAGGGVYQLVTNTTYWAKQKQVSTFRAIYAGLSALSPGLTLLMLEFLKSSMGLPSSFAIFSLITLVTSIFAFKLLKAPYYHQFLNEGFTPDEAKTKADTLGQEHFPSRDQDSFWQSIRRVIKDPRCLTLIIALLSSSGGFISSSTSFYITLTEVAKLDTQYAVLLTSVGSICTALARIVSGPFVDWFDHAHCGMRVFMGSALMVAIGAFTIGIPRPFPSMYVVVPAKLLMDAFFGVGGNATFQMALGWSKPSNPNVAPYSVGVMNGMISTFGSASGIIFPLITALFVLLSGEEGYSNNFVFIGLFSILSMLLTCLVGRRTNRTLSYLFSQASPQETNVPANEVNTLQLG